MINGYLAWYTNVRPAYCASCNPIYLQDKIFITNLRYQQIIDNGFSGDVTGGKVEMRILLPFLLEGGDRGVSAPCSLPP